MILTNPVCCQIQNLPASECQPGLSLKIICNGEVPSGSLKKSTAYFSLPASVYKSNNKIKSLPQSLVIFFCCNTFFTQDKCILYLFFGIREVNRNIYKILYSFRRSQSNFDVYWCLRGLHSDFMPYKYYQIFANFIILLSFLLVTLSKWALNLVWFSGENIKRKEIQYDLLLDLIKQPSGIYNIAHQGERMEIELQDMEHGKPINFTNMAQQKQAKIKQLKAKKQYNQLLQYANSLPPNRDKYILKANALMHLRKWKDLIQCCDKGLEEDDDSQFYNMKGRAQGKLGNMQEKAVLTRKAIELDPSVPAYYRNLGAALYKLKKYEQAIENHKKAVSMEPENSINYHNVGAALFRLQKYEQAKDFFQKSIAKNNKEALSHSWLGDCHKKTGNMDEAIKCYTRAYEVSGNEVYRKQRDALQKQHNPKKGFFSKLFG